MEPEEALERWENFLGKIKSRALEIIEQAEQGCTMLLDLNGLDPLPMTNAWSAIETQLLQLTGKIDDTWDERVEPVLEAAGWDGDKICGERKKGEALRRWAERQREQVGIRIFGGAAEKVLAEAKRLLGKDYYCSQCGAQLAVSDCFFRAVHITCEYCENVNTFVPGAKVKAVEYFCVHHLAQQKTQDLYFAWLAAEEQMKIQDEDAEAKDAAEVALKTYTEAYLRARIEVVPELAKDFDKDLKGKMAFFYEDYAQYAQHDP